MTTQTRDIQFDTFIVELTDALDLQNVDFSFGIVEAVVGGAVALYEAFARPEPGVVSLATRGLVV